MLEYITIPGPVGLTIEKKDSYSAAVNQYADIINAQARQGWKLECIQEIPVTKNNGCLAAMGGNATTTVTFNMLVFSREV